jgi:hypothetical protein
LQDAVDPGFQNNQIDGGAARKTDGATEESEKDLFKSFVR